MEAGEKPAVPETDGASPVPMAELDFERSMGITEYMSAIGARGTFSGSLKARYADFMVYEVDKAGQPVKPVREAALLHYSRNKPVEPNKPAEPNKPVESKPKPDLLPTVGTTTDGPADEELPAGVAVVVPATVTVPDPTHPPLEISVEDRALLHKALSEDIVSAMLALFPRLPLPFRPSAAEIFTTGSIENKEERGLFHGHIRRIFNSKLDSRTEKDNKITIVPVPPPNKANKRTRDNRNRNDKQGQGSRDAMPVPMKDQDYLHFTLTKLNKDTMDCVSILTRLLRAKPKDLTFAGNKDRRAVTTQRMSLFKVSPQRLRNLKTIGFNVGGPFVYSEDKVELGDLTGNQFIITLRDLTFSEADSPQERQRLIDDGMSCLRDRGFINYYGLQRFGTFGAENASTHDIGRFLLQGKYEEAIMGILTPSAKETSQDEGARNKALQMLRDDPSSVHVARETLPRKYVAESRILTHISAAKTDGGAVPWLACWISLPRGLRLLYLHAYQSFVWNHVASERVRLGDGLLVGDLVFVDSSDQAPADPMDLENGDEAAAPTTQVHPKIRSLTVGDIESGRYTIFDIVLPSPGWAMQYPSATEQPSVWGTYDKIMKSDGLDMNDMRRPHHDLSLSGDYRKVFSKPVALNCHLVKYAEETDEIVQPATATQDHFDIEPRILTNPSGERTAMVIGLQINSSCYATMALREVVRGGLQKPRIQKFGFTDER